MYSIIIDGFPYGGYDTAIAAADDVFTFSTGCPEWDNYCIDTDNQVDVPMDISAWICIG